MSLFRQPGMALCLYTLFLLIGTPLTNAASSASFLQADFNQPSDIAISEDGRAWVLDGVNGRVVVFSANGEKAFAFGRPGSGDGELNLPMGIAIGAERIYIADSANHRIAVFKKSGRFVRNIALSGDPEPEPVGLIANDHEIFWTDRRHHRICRYDLELDQASRCWGGRGEAEGELQYPFQIAADRDGYLSVVDVLNGRVQQFHRNGRFTFVTSRFGLGAGELYRPNGLAFAEDGWMLVSDSYRGTVSVFNKGRFQQLMSNAAGDPLRFESPVGIAIHKDRVYVVEAGANRISIHRLASAQASKHVGSRRSVAFESRKNCQICHLSWAENYTAAEGVQDGVPPVATEKMCYSCHHGAVIDSRTTVGHAGQHPDVHHPRKNDGARAKREDQIPESFPLLAGKEPEAQRLSCGSCHTPHTTATDGAGTLYVEHANPWMRVPSHGGNLCQKCHESRLDSALDKEHPLSGVNHPVGIFLNKPPKKGAQGYATSKDLHHGLPKALLNKGAALGKQDEMICQSCHQIHGGETDKLTVLDYADSSLCESCHARQHAKDKEDARRKGVHPVNFDLDEPVKINGKKIKRVTCLTCHSMHAGKAGTPALIEDHRDGRLCSHCHEAQAQVVGSDHDLLVTAPDSKNRFGQRPEKAGLCGSCHSLHRGDGRAPFLYVGEFHPWEGEQAAFERDKLCLDCHREEGVAEQALVEHFSHPARDMVLRSAVDKMPLLDPAEEIHEFGAIACISCHNPHRWSARKTQRGNGSSIIAKNQDGNILNSFLRQWSPGDSFCTRCHGLETVIKYKYYHDKMVRDKGIEYLR